MAHTAEPVIIPGVAIGVDRGRAAAAPKETAHGAPEDGIVVNDRDIVEIFSNRVVVCVALTQVAGIHNRAENWIHCDDQIEAQFDPILDELESETA